MVRKLIRHGNDLALVIEESVLIQLGINETTPLSISIEGDALVVAPVRDRRAACFVEALEQVNSRYRVVLSRLAE